MSQLCRATVSATAKRITHLPCYSACVVDYLPIPPQLDNCTHRCGMRCGRDHRYRFAEGAEGRERFSAESKGRDLGQFLEGRKLGCVVFEPCRERELIKEAQTERRTYGRPVGLLNTRAIVHDLDGIEAMIFDSDVCRQLRAENRTESWLTDTSGSRIKCILNELLDYSLEVKNDLARVDAMYRLAVDGWCQRWQSQDFRLTLDGTRGHSDRLFPHDSSTRYTKQTQTP